MAELKTKPTTENVNVFLDRTTEGERRSDCRAVAALMKEITGAEPRMWGAGIVGFGTYRYQAGAREAEWPVIAFSPRKNDLTLYLMPGHKSRAALLAKLGKHKEGKSCVYLKRLGDVDIPVLKRLISDCVVHMKKSYPTTF